jgi:uncharacterized protein YcnI
MTMHLLRTLLLGLVCVSGAAPALAHVTASPNEAAAGSYFQTAFTVPHGCSASPTVAVRVKIPDGVTGVKPQMKPGWEITITKRKLAKPVDVGHGQTIDEAVDEVAWRGGPLPDSYFDTFGLMMKLPDGGGRTLYFPIVQECQQGVHRWIAIPAAGQKWHELKEPAPFVRLKP